jgi:glycosyltransferase involved in cell wall biosynthesis
MRLRHPQLDEPNAFAHRLICHINIAPDYRGGERQTELLVTELAARGWTQRLIVRHGNPLAERCSLLPSVEVMQVAGNPVSAAIAARGSHLIHAHEARSIYSGWLSSALLSIPFVLTRRVDNALKPSWIRDAAYNRAASVIAISGAIASEIGRNYPDIRCNVLPDANSHLAQDAQQVAALADRYKGKTVIGHIGALVHRQKGQRTIIEAARISAVEHPEWHFLLLGKGEDEEEFRRAAADLPNIEILGFVDNVADYLAAFDYFVFPSLHEGMGPILLDAMYFGLPIVATNVGGIPEIVEDGVNGSLIAPEEPKALVAAISKLMADDEARNSMCAANEIKARLYGADRMAQSYEEIYRSILASA